MRSASSCIARGRRSRCTCSWVDGEIRGSESVVAPACLRDEPRELAQTEAPGPLEHHVLERVSDTVVPVPRPCCPPIPYLMNDGGCAVVFLHDERKPFGR